MLAHQRLVYRLLCKHYQYTMYQTSDSTLGVNDMASKSPKTKYTCHKCGSKEVRSDFHSYDVFCAEGGTTLRFLRTESTDPGFLKLYCYKCGIEIPVKDITKVKIYS